MPLGSERHAVQEPLIRYATEAGGWRPPKQMPRYEGRGSDAVLVADEHGVRAAR